MDESIIYYSGPRFDRSGATLHRMLVAKAWCTKRNLKYIGCPISPDDNETRKLLKYLNIENTYCWWWISHDQEKKKDKSKYRQVPPIKLNTEEENFTPEVVNKITSNFNYTFNEIYQKKFFTITIHIRRGDVSIRNGGPRPDRNRYTYNKYYKDILQKALEELKNHSFHVVINICSESKTSESFDEFKELKSNDCSVNMYLDTELQNVFNLMIHADIFIMAKSSFSFVPAIYNKRCIVYEPFWHKKLNHWLDSTEEDFDEQLKQEIKNLIEKYHQ